MKKFKKITWIFITFAIILTGTFFVFYLKMLPKLVQSPKVINQAEKIISDITKFNVKIKNPKLNTYFAPKTEFFIKEFSVTKDEKLILNIEDLELAFSFKRLLSNRSIFLRKLGCKRAYIDVNGFEDMLRSETTNEQSNLPIKIRWYRALLYLNNLEIDYKTTNDLFINVNAKDIKLTSEKDPKFIKFDFNLNVKQKDNQLVNIRITDKDNIFTAGRTLFIKDLILDFNNSVIKINSELGQVQSKTNVNAKNFNINSLLSLIDSNLIIPNGKDVVSMLKDTKGFFNMNLDIVDNKINGKIDINNGFLKLIPLADMPVYLDKGEITFDEKDLHLNNFEGWYGHSKNNTVKMSGEVTNYQLPTAKTLIKIVPLVTNDFAENYLSKVANIPITTIGQNKTLFLIKCFGDKMDITWLYKVPKGDDVLIAGSSFSPKTYDRAIKGDMTLKGNYLTINEINYYIAKDIDREHRPTKAIIKFTGLFDILKNGEPEEFGFEIPDPLPSEFLNLFAGPKVFKGGSFYGNIKYINKNKIPKLTGFMHAEKIRIPSQRLSIREGNFTTNADTLNIFVKGRFKKAAYEIDGKIANSMLLPVVIKDANITIDNLDVERFLASVNAQQAPNQTAVQSSDKKPQEDVVVDEETNTTENDDFMFNTNLIVIENCVFNLVKGVYKDLNFGNLKAGLTLDKNGILNIQSNKFDFAEGISTLKVICDLQNLKYYVRLGSKDVSSNAIAKSLLNLDKEIDGKAKALIELNTDRNMKLNGQIKFEIADGTITKLGYVKYLLNFVALFRNPIAMITPSTIFDLVNIPEGSFKSINGELLIKDNIINKLAVKSASSQLSAYITGRMNLENGDTTIRLYTMFSNKNKGFAGFLRGFSLNTLANRMQYNRQSSLNYYEAEVSQIPKIDADEKDCQIFLTKIDGDIQNNNFLSSLKKLK